MLGQRGEDWGAHWRPGAGGELARVGAHTGGGGKRGGGPPPVQAMLCPLGCFCHPMKAVRGHPNGPGAPWWVLRCRGLHPGVTLPAPAPRSWHIPPWPRAGIPTGISPQQHPASITPSLASQPPPQHPPPPPPTPATGLLSPFKDNFHPIWAGPAARLYCKHALDEARSARPPPTHLYSFAQGSLPACAAGTDTPIRLPSQHTTAMGREMFGEAMRRGKVTFPGHQEPRTGTGCHAAGTGCHARALGAMHRGRGTTDQHRARCTGHAPGDAGAQGPSAGAVPALDVTLRGCTPLHEPVGPRGPRRQMANRESPDGCTKAPLPVPALPARLAAGRGDGGDVGAAALCIYSCSEPRHRSSASRLQPQRLAPGSAPGSGPGAAGSAVRDASVPIGVAHSVVPGPAWGAARAARMGKLRHGSAPGARRDRGHPCHGCWHAIGAQRRHWARIPRGWGSRLSEPSRPPRQPGTGSRPRLGAAGRIRP